MLEIGDSVIEGPRTRIQFNIHSLGTKKKKKKRQTGGDKTEEAGMYAMDGYAMDGYAMDAGRKKLKEEEQEVRNVYRTGSFFSGIMKGPESILVVS
jgi:hypothetical protein